MMCLHPRLWLPLVLSALLLAGLSRGSARAAEAPEGMVLVAAGPYLIGSNAGNVDERPAHRAKLPAFFIDRTEVTVAEYARFVQATGHAAPPDWPGGTPDPKRLRHPVVNVSWFDANAYARWAGKRLPTEAEWEKAARGGDGRSLPWGNEWAEGRANLQAGEDKELRPVGSYPDGASPCGAVDMLGNAWEWTADWYHAYAGNGVPSIHYGQKYRVVRGCGGIDFYPPLNAKRVTVRGRIQPFGRYDSVGFRCVVDAAPPKRTAPELAAPSEREKPVPPPAVTPAEVAARYPNGVPVRIAEGQGVGRDGVATFGLPFPEGVVRDAAQLRSGTPLQARPLATWRDGSLRWALVDLPAAVKPGGSDVVRVTWSGTGAVPEPRQRVSVQEQADGLSIDTGAAVLRIRTGEARWLSLKGTGGELNGPEERVVATEADGTPVALTARPPTRITVEDSGPLRARVRVEGWLEDALRKPVLRYRYRLDARAGSASVGVLHTFTRLSPRKMLLVRGYRLRFATPPGDDRTQFGGAGAVLDGAAGARLEQLSAAEYGFRSSEGSAPVTGTRADGWVSCGKDGALLVALKQFWQQFPKALEREPNGVAVDLWAGAGAFEADQGLSKSHELLLSVNAAGEKRAAALADLREPLFGTAPAEWYCATRSLGVLAPYSLAKYPQYETEVEAAADLQERSHPYGMRDYGDNYFGGPYKGIHSFQDLEYDVSYNQFMQFARTGARKYLDIGLREARHGGDIDLKHDAGPQWKHSPRHTTTEAELGHVFCRGLIASTWLTGNPEGLENARILGDWLVKVVENPRSQGNERQIGWALYALTGIYEATWDARYLRAMKANVDRLLAGQDALGRFSIRYDNRISFFYGITLSGLVKYYEVTGDERIPESIRRIVTRLHGFYPEYGGRTLEGLAWLYTRTGDPEVRLTAQHTWETTMTWRPFDIGGMTIFTTRFLPSVETLGLACPPKWRIPETGPEEDGMHRHHYRAPSGVLYLQAADRRKPVELVLLRHVGNVPATVWVTDPKSRQVALLRLPATGEPLQYARVHLPAGGPYRVELKSATTRAWDLITTEPTRRVFHAPNWQYLEALTPRLYFRPVKGTHEIRLTLEADKEGFKGAVLYDSRGRVAGALQQFVDFGDEQHHTYELRVPVAPGSGLWSLDLQEVSVSKAAGVVPYFSTRPEAYFQPGK